ncbi:unnamed protein product, partial [Phaeothamnion confervicola]
MDDVDRDCIAASRQEGGVGAAAAAAAAPVPAPTAPPGASALADGRAVVATQAAVAAAAATASDGMLPPTGDFSLAETGMHDGMNLEIGPQEGTEAVSGAAEHESMRDEASGGSVSGMEDGPSVLCGSAPAAAGAALDGSWEKGADADTGKWLRKSNQAKASGDGRETALAAAGAPSA